MLTYEELAGQSGALDRLREDFARRDFAHAYLITGPSGTGKRSAAELLAMTGLCSGEKKPCGTCGACRRALAGTHPDILSVRPEEGKKQIGVDIIRDVSKTLSSRAFEDGARMVLIPEAQTMNVQAQNALLKTLEEPPEDTAFLLVTDNPGALLPTVVSRCRMVRFHPLTQEMAVKRLVALGQTTAAAEKAARLSGGCIGQALKIDARQLELTVSATRDLFSVRKPENIPEALKQCPSERTAQRQLLDVLDDALRNILLAQAGGSELPAGLYAPAAEQYAIRVPVAGGLKLAREITQARVRMESNVSFPPLYERILFTMTEEYQKWPW